MAKPIKVGTRWRAQVRKKGVSDSKYFDAYADAVAWTTKREAEILEGIRRPTSVTFRDLVARYVREVTPTHKSDKWEINAAARFESSVPWIDWPLSRVGALQVVEWRDKRGAKVTPGTVRREFGFMSAIFRHAISEWHNVTANPCAGVKRPPTVASRDRVISPDEEKAILEKLTPRVAAVFSFALETGMRAGEICGLTWDRVSDKSVRLEDTKNGTKRTVPLSTRARELLAEERKVSPGPSVFGIGSGSLDTMFRRGRDAAGLSDIHFHDTRHTAATRIAPKLQVLDLCRMFGWKDPRFAMVYYNATADTIADRLG